MMRVVPIALLLASAVGAASGQQTAPPSASEDTSSGVIVGQVIDPGTGRGIPGAIVTISGSPGAQPPAPGGAPPRPQPSALTTADGRFLFRDLRKGTYHLNATRPGYLPGSHGARRPGGGSAPVDLESGEQVTDIVVPLWRWASLSGRIVDEAGEPIVGLDVRAYRRGITNGRRQFASAGTGRTDDRGEYRISMLSPGDYVVAVVSAQVSMPQTVADGYREAVQPGMEVARSPVAVAAIELGGVQPAGSPGTIQIGSSLQTLRGPTPPPATDETRVFVYPTTFHPAARTVREATVVSLRSGAERDGIDLDLKPVRAVRVAGVTTGPDGPAPYITIRLEPGSDDLVLDPEASTVSDGTGAFVFPSVPSGQYTLRASRVPRPGGIGGPPTIIQSGGTTISTVSGPATPGPLPPPSDPTLWAAIPLSVGQSALPDVAVPLLTGTRVRGRVEFEGAAERPSVSQLQHVAIVLEPESSPGMLRSTPPGRVDEKGEFVTGGAVGGRYFVRAAVAPQGWHFKETRYEGLDLADTPIALDGREITGVRIVFTDQPAELSGVVRTGRSAGDPDATVLIFPSDPERWQQPNPRRMRSVRVSKTGTYKTTALPSGDYYVIAVPDETATDWQDAKVLATLAAGASRVTIEDGDKKTQDLRTQARR